MSATPQFSPYPGMTVGQILNRVYRLLRVHFKLLVGIASVPGISILITYGAVLGGIAKSVMTGMQGGQLRPDAAHLTWALMTGFFAIMVVQLAVFAIYLASASYAAVQADCGIRVTFREAYGVAFSRVGHYLLLILTMYAVTFFPAFLLEIPLILTSIFVSSSHAIPNPAFFILFPLGFLLSFAAFIAGALVALRLSLAFPASVFEPLTVWNALRRSWTLTRGALGRIFVVVLAIYAAIYGLISIVLYGAFSVGAIGWFVFSGPHDHPSKPAITSLVVFAIVIYAALIAVCGTASWAGFATSFAVIYNDQRLRIEGTAVNAPTGAQR